MPFSRALVKTKKSTVVHFLKTVWQQYLKTVYLKYQAQHLFFQACCFLFKSAYLQMQKKNHIIAPGIQKNQHKFLLDKRFQTTVNFVITLKEGMCLNLSDWTVRKKKTGLLPFHIEFLSNGGNGGARPICSTQNAYCP